MLRLDALLITALALVLTVTPGTHMALHITTSNPLPLSHPLDSLMITPPRSTQLSPYTYPSTGSWTVESGGPGTDMAKGIALGPDGIYVTGSTDGVLPGQTALGGLDGFVMKYSFMGRLAWSLQFGTSADDDAKAIAVDSTGIYVAGDTSGNFTGQTGVGGRDIFVWKYYLNATEAWTSQFGSSADDEANSISVDSTGVYVAGSTDGALSGCVYSGGSDAFVRKLDLDGNAVWTRQFGTSYDDEIYGIAAENSNVYVTGFTRGSLLGQTSLGLGISDAFVSKFDASGTQLWTRQFGTSAADWPYGIALGSTGVYVTGLTYGNVTSPFAHSTGYIDGFISKYDFNGDQVWIRQFGGPTVDIVYSVSIGSTGVYLAGMTYGTSVNQTYGGSDAFLRRFSFDGTELRDWEWGTSGDVVALGVSAYASSAYVTGWTDGAFPGQTFAGMRDIFLTKLVDYPPDFVLSASPGLMEVGAGDTGVYQLQLTSLNGFSGIINLTATEDPGGQNRLAARVVPASVNLTAGGTVYSSISITTVKGAPPATYAVTIQAIGISAGYDSSSSQTHYYLIPITVKPQLTPSPPTLILGLKPIEFYGLVVAIAFGSLASMFALWKKNPRGIFPSRPTVSDSAGM